MTVRTEELLERLAAWQERGLVTEQQAAAIAAYERGRGDGTGAAARTARTTAAEAIGYVGAALVLGAVALLVGEYWDGLTDGGRLALAALLTVVLAGAAAALRGATSAAISRLVSVLLVGAVAGVSWCASIVTGGLLGWRSDDVALAVGVVATAAAVPAHLARRQASTQLALLVAVLTLLSALLMRPALDLEIFWYALPYAAVGAVWLLLGDGGYLRPRVLASVTGGTVTLVALQSASFGDIRVQALMLGLVVAAGLVAAAVASGGLHHLAVGAVGLFVLVPQLVFELFGDAIGAPATLLLVGVLLVLLAVGLGRARREVTATGGAA